MGRIFHGDLASVGIAIALLALTSSGRQLPAQDIKKSTPDRVVAVNIIGNKRITTQEISSLIRTRPGDIFDKDKIYEDLVRLGESDLFISVRIGYDKKDTGFVVTFRVEEYPNTIEKVEFRHARHTSCTDLLEGLPKIQEGMPVNPTLNKNACYEIRGYLRYKGRLWANVALEEGANSSDKRVIFNITEGPIVRVRSIKFVGEGKLAEPSVLRKQIVSTAESLHDAALFDEAVIEADVMRLEIYFSDHGCRSAKIERELIFSEDASRVDVVFHIDEGRRERPKKIEAPGPQSEATDFPLIPLAKDIKGRPKIHVLPIMVLESDGTFRGKPGPKIGDLGKDDEMQSKENPFDLPDNLPNAVKAAHQSDDMDKLGLALASLTEPLQNGGARAQQDLHVKILIHAATKYPDPLVRVGAIQALGKYQDRRAARALVQASCERIPFVAGINSKIRVQAISALANTKSEVARRFLLEMATAPLPDSDGRTDYRQHYYDERLAALRGLAYFPGPETAEAIGKIFFFWCQVALDPEE